MLKEQFEHELATFHEYAVTDSYFDDLGGNAETGPIIVQTMDDQAALGEIEDFVSAMKTIISELDTQNPVLNETQFFMEISPKLFYRDIEALAEQRDQKMSGILSEIFNAQEVVAEAVALIGEFEQEYLEVKVEQHELPYDDGTALSQAFGQFYRGIQQVREAEYWMNYLVKDREQAWSCLQMAAANYYPATRNISAAFSVFEKFGRAARGWLR